MRVAVQRVSRASVCVNGENVGEIGCGLLLLAGFAPDDTEEDCARIAKKISSLRIFADENDKTNLSLADIGGEVLCISQFTLYADCTHGNRPSFTGAARPEQARRLYDCFCAELERFVPTKRGIFGADMKVSLLNDGPFTVVLE